MPEPPLEYIEITADHVGAGGDTPKGTVVRVAHIGEDSARRLIKGGKARRVATARGEEAVVTQERKAAKEESRG